MLLRILTSVVLIPLVVALVWWGPPAATAAAAALVAILALVEFFGLGSRLGLRAFPKWTIFCAALIFYSQYSVGMLETRTIAGGEAMFGRRETAGNRGSLLPISSGSAFSIRTRRSYHAA